MKYGQKRQSKDIQDKPLDEFITQTSNNMADTADQTPVNPGAAAPEATDAREIDEEGLELKRRDDKNNEQENDVEKMGNHSTP